MANPYYTDTLEPADNTRGVSAKIRTQFAAVEDAFDLVEHTFMETIDLNTAASYWFPVPWACDIVRFSSAIDALPAVPDVDTDLTLEIVGVLVTGSTLRIATAGAAAGDYDKSATSPLVAANSVAADGVIELICDGASTVAANARVLITVKRTA